MKKRPLCKTRSVRPGHTIRVSADDIEHGSQALCFDCPIARATLRRFNAAGRVLNSSIEINGIFYILPRKAKEFIFSFDKGEGVAPFAFKLGARLNSAAKMHAAR